MGEDEKFGIQVARNYKVVKDNKLIQDVTRKKYELSILEQKILGFIISMIKPPTPNSPFPCYQLEFDIRLFCKVCGIDFENGKNYQNIKIALKRLADNSFWIEEDDDELLFQWINTPRIKNKSGKDIIKISDDVMPYLYNLQEKFTSYELYQILALKGSHSIALYELFKSYLFRKSVKFSIDDIKKYLSLEDKYKEYKEFRRRVIEPSVKEINEYTDLQVEWEPIKKGRTYVGIHFKIKNKERWEGLAAYRKTISELDGGVFDIISDEL